MTVSSRSDLAGMQRVGALVADTLDAMRRAVAPGVTTADLDDIAARVARRAGETAARHKGAVVFRELAGHGIGHALHEAPEVPNWPDPSARMLLVEGMVSALEPMLTRVPTRIVEERDGWTIRTASRAIAVHHEHTIMIRDGAPLVLTPTRAAAW
ncbi:MAG: M24 family metallopeptidase [Gemmatimonadota bacterium]